jgi:hypothetical protein
MRLVSFWKPPYPNPLIAASDGGYPSGAEAEESQGGEFKRETPELTTLLIFSIPNSKA